MKSSPDRSQTPPRLIVGVGASAGGLEAFKQLLAAVPGDSGMTFLLVQHLAPGHRSLLRELLAPVTDLEVVEAEHGVRLRPDTVYIIRPDTALGIAGDRLEVAAPTGSRGVRLPVDHLFRSLAAELEVPTAGVVLSGAGSDGSDGLRELKASGGLAVAQSPDTAEQAGMPQSAVDTGAVDLALPLAEIPAALERFARLPRQARLHRPAEAPLRPTQIEPEKLEAVAAIIESHGDFDLRVYKAGTVERRLLRRMGLSGIESIDEYLAKLGDEATERDALIRDLLISVTEFFRDDEAFEALRDLVIDPMITRIHPGQLLRIWVPGCATGEEVYSIAMVVRDAIRDLRKTTRVQIFATDIDQDALAIARAAVYPASIEERVSPRRLKAYFTPLEGPAYQVRPALRDLVSFAVHDLTRDPPFSRMDIVSCRNVLIYLTPETQARVLERLHFALNPDGYLVLSTSESTGQQKGLFSTVSKSQRIYRKLGDSRPIAVSPARSRPLSIRISELAAAGSPTSPPATPGTDLARQLTLETWAPPTVAVATDGSILFSHGELDRYLRFPQGEAPRLELPALLRTEIATRTRTALFRCRRSGRPETAVTSPDGKGSRQVRITAHPADTLGSGAVLLSFEELEPEPEAPALPDDSDPSALASLERELEATREDLRHTVAELESANEQLRSSNEEALSMNEELQSANEELEATTEELRSLNEELTTVNAQLREKVQQLEQTNDDLHNFFASTKIATLFLDERQRIKRFTPAARQLLDLDQDDIGQSIGRVSHELLGGDLEAGVRAVLDNFETRSQTLATGDGGWFSRDLRPYRTESRRVEGVVVTFLDITEIKQATESLAARERQQATIARIGLHALREVPLPGFMEEVVRDVRQTLDTDLCEILERQPGSDKLLLRAGVGFAPGQVGSALDAGPDSQAGYTLQTGEPVIVEDLASEKRFSGPRILIDHGVASGLSCVIRDGSLAYGVLATHCQKRRSFSREDANFLQAVANIIGSAIVRSRTRRRLAIESGIAHDVAEATGPDEALDRALESLEANLSIRLCELWWDDDGGESLRRTRLRVANPAARQRVAELLDRETAASGEGLVGRVFKSREAIWCTDLGPPELFLEPAVARELEIVSGFGIPLCSGGESLGVITIYSNQRLSADAVFLRSLESVGRDLGDYVMRARYEAWARHLAAITESSHDAILTYDRDRIIVDWLEGAEELYGYTADEIRGRSLDVIVPEDWRTEVEAINARIFGGEIVGPFETTRRRKDGSQVAVSVRSSVVRDRSDQIIGVASTDRDITEQKLTERRLVEADRQKDEFIAMLGHELRNPLAAIRSASELLRMTTVSPDQLEQTQQVLARQSAHMAKLLDGLLDVSRIIRGKITLDPVAVDINEVCREVVADAIERTADRDLDIHADMPMEPIWVEADRVRLVQIVDNLLSNAVKYTADGGSINLSLGRDGDEALLRVRDTGVGIDPDLLPHIFEVFRQSKQSIDRAEGGLGLGLALARSLTELHRGTIAARSAGKDRGSEFTVRLPVTEKAPATTPPKPAGPTDALRLLIIEDNVDAADMLQQLLEVAGYEVLIAERGRDGVELARERDIDVVLCDLGLPDISGYQVARELRANGDRPFLVALSGYGRPEDKELGVDAGFDAHITKPVDINALRRLLEGAAHP